MRVVSLVPSWTETLLACHVNVVGRTRYCIHPQGQVSHIPVVGGTKDIQWNEVKKLNPDILILDREENPKSFAEQSPYPIFASHVCDVYSVARDLLAMANCLSNRELIRIAERWQIVTQKPEPVLEWADFPGVKEWWVKPQGPIDSIEYVIWRKPWMVVTEKTFIGSMLAQLGLAKMLRRHEGNPYPQVDLDSMLSNNRLFMYSSEPYSFSRHRQELSERGFPSVLVDGESFSWFGLRSLDFLESVKK
jgi:iron complex transport system substrate-binding protein